jgi:peptide methionine sulfoxide reductase msrA/msrB
MLRGRVVGPSIKGEKMSHDDPKKLTAFEKYVLVDKGTERPNTGLYTHFKQEGTYHCKQCGATLYRSADKFDSGCGWPSFDQEIAGAVTRVPDADGRRTEIICTACKGHLGHVFHGEKYTPKDTRHCVNSVSVRFVPKESHEYRQAVFASGCFWGTEYFLARVPGVIKTLVGYSGGQTQNPTYEAVCSGNTGHVECVQVTYDPKVVNYESLAKIFFETHDFTQTDGQGPDRGSQYLSVLFFGDDQEKQVAEELLKDLKRKGFEVATKLRPAERVWAGEEYHRDYYERRGEVPYCHRYKKIF